MAEQIVSPGVFTNEKDLSFLPAGIASIGAAIVGPTVKGPAFIPTVVTSFTDFVTKFGGLSEETYVPYAVQNYLRNAGSVTVMRIIQTTGYTAGAVNLVYRTGSTNYLVGTIMPSTNFGTSINDANGFTTSNFTSSGFAGGSTSGSYGFVLNGTGITGTTSKTVLTGSLNTTSANSLFNVLGTSPKANAAGYLYTWFNGFLTSNYSASGATIIIDSGSVSALVSQSATNTTAYTPTVTSQFIGGTTQDLFQFYTLADGTDTNTSVKISIINTQLPTSQSYGLFTVVVRDFNDTDQRPVVLETYTNLTLDPNSSDYIARRIGDKYQLANAAGVISIYGDYPNVSKYVRVSPSAAVSNGSMTILAKPYGFAAPIQPISSSYAMPTASVVTKFPQINGLYSNRAYYGWNFDVTDNNNYLKPIALGATTNGTAFNLDSCFVHPSASSNPGASLSGSSFSGTDVSNYMKFSLPFQGGFDGMNPAMPKNVGSAITSANLFGLDCSDSSKPGSVSYIKALNILSNADQYDMNILAVPGATIDKHPSIINTAIDVAETRGDCFVIADPVVQGGSVSSAIAAVNGAGIDSNYVGTYWPWVKILDTDKNKPVWVPPSVVLPGVLAYNDSVSFEWFAPAGLNRGGIGTAVDVESRLSFSDRDALYAARINPIASFPNQGICVWGQKTLQSLPSALDRINVRRLLIALKKYIASSTRYLVFDNNTNETRQRFLNIVNPYLEKVKSRQGLYAFQVVMDETNNTPDVIDRNIMYGEIYLQPAKAAEFIVLDFNVLPTGATFTNA